MSTATLVSERFVRVHGWLLDAVGDRDDEQLRERVAPTAPSIGFHLWHVARWADRVQAALPSMHPDLVGALGLAEQLWLSGGLARAWGFPLAVAADVTGMGLDDDVSASLPLPAKSVLLEYATRTFAAADRAAAAAATEEIFAAPCTDLYGRTNPIGSVVIGHLSHAGRHLGMIEALRGLSGRGTATI